MRLRQAATGFQRLSNGMAHPSLYGTEDYASSAVLPPRRAVPCHQSSTAAPPPPCTCRSQVIPHCTAETVPGKHMSDAKTHERIAERIMRFLSAVPVTKLPE